MKKKITITYKAKCPYCGYINELGNGLENICIHFENYDQYEITFAEEGESDDAASYRENDSKCDTRLFRKA